MEHLNLYTLDYRLSGHSVNFVVGIIKKYLENVLKEKIEHCPKSVFYNILDFYKLKKEFSTFVKERGLPEEVLYSTFLNQRISEIMCNINYWARVFETEKEDRTNRKHIKRMLPYFKEMGRMAAFFSVENSTAPPSYKSTSPTLTELSEALSTSEEKTDLQHQIDTDISTNPDTIFGVRKKSKGFYIGKKS